MRSGSSPRSAAVNAANVSVASSLSGSGAKVLIKPLMSAAFAVPVIAGSANNAATGYLSLLWV